MAKNLLMITPAGGFTQFPNGEIGQILGMGRDGPVWTGPSAIVIADPGNFFANDNLESALQQLAAGQTRERIEEYIQEWLVGQGFVAGLLEKTVDDESEELINVQNPI